MKVAITGHTAGLGKALFDAFPDSVGFSRSNGHNILTDGDIIVDKIKDCDVFINNAYDDFSQIELLYAVFELWKDQDKTIINISSNSSDGIKTKPHKYAIYKTALDKASEQLCYSKYKCKIVNVRPGWMDTQRVSNIKEAKINLIDVVELVKFIIMEKSYTIKEITILPL